MCRRGFSLVVILSLLLAMGLDSAAVAAPAKLVGQAVVGLPPTVLAMAVGGAPAAGAWVMASLVLGGYGIGFGLLFWRPDKPTPRVKRVRRRLRELGHVLLFVAAGIGLLEVLRGPRAGGPWAVVWATALCVAAGYGIGVLLLAWRPKLPTTRVRRLRRQLRALARVLLFISAGMTVAQLAAV